MGIEKEIYRILPSELIKYCKTLILAGSRDLEADLDLYLILDQEAPGNIKNWVEQNPETKFEGIAKHGIDLSSLAQPEFEKRVKMLDVFTAHPLLDGKPLLREEYFKQMLEKGQSIIPTQEHVIFSFRESLRCYDTARTQFEIAKLESRNQEMEIEKYYKNIIMNIPIQEGFTQQLFNTTQMLGFSVSYLICSELFENPETRMISLKSLLEMNSSNAKFLNEVIKYKKELKRNTKPSFQTINNYLDAQRTRIKQRYELLPK